MGEHVAAVHTATNALQALGRGFDVNFDTRLLYCKGVSGSRVVEIDEEHRRELWLYEDVAVPDVSRDIGCSPDATVRQSSGVRSFKEVNFAIENFPFFGITFSCSQGFVAFLILWEIADKCADEATIATTEISKTLTLWQKLQSWTVF